MSTLGQLNYLLDKKTKRRLALLFVAIFLSSAAELLGVTIILPIVNLAMDTGNIADNMYCRIVMKITGATTKESVLLWLIGATIVIYIVKNLYICFVYRAQYRFSSDVKRNLATKLMSSYLKQPYSYFLNVNSSDLMRNVSSDVDHLYQLISNVLLIISNGITAVAIILFLAITNFLMTIVVAIVLAICLCIIVFGLQKRNRQNGRENQYLQGQLNKHLKQSFEGVKEIKVMNTEKQFIQNYDKTFRRISDINVTFSLFSTIPKYLIEVFAVSSVLVFLAVNIAFNANYLAVIPQLAVFCVAAFKLLPSVNQLYGSINTIIYYKASIDLVYNDIKETESFKNTFEDSEEGVTPLAFQKEIKVESVSFKYPNTDRNILTKANIVIPKGNSVAFIGASGGGKTTTADILLNLLDVDEGRVTVDDVDIKTNPRAWNRKLGYIPQIIYLTDDTIRANVAFGLEASQVDDREVWRALEEAQLKEFVESLPQGLDTEVGERGVRISGGQRQRIGIARALYRNPEILVFDEATSALDNETEKEVMKAINGLQGTKTMIMIAHRLSTIENCDVVYKVENGTVEKTKG